jgi:hypothetical protein
VNVFLSKDLDSLLSQALTDFITEWTNSGL